MQERTLLVALALVMTGCLAATDAPAPAGTVGELEPLTDATHKLGKFVSFKVKSFDGTPIHVDMKIPDGEGPFPTVIDYTPYSLLGQDLSGALLEHGAEDPLGFAEGDTFLAYGYAVGVAHVRGTGESGGCLSVGGPNEAKDGYSVVEHIANQSWSNGKVALLGTSYVGTTPIATAELQPPHLAAIVPMSGVTEWYKYYFELGAHRRNGDPFPGSSDTDPVLWAAMGLAPGARTGGTGGPEEAACGAEFFMQDYGQDDYNAYWKARDLAKDAANITVPVLYAHGWDDGNVAPNMIPRFLANLTNSPDAHAWLQQHGHGVPASKKAFHEYVHRFLDRHLLGRNNGAELLPRVIVETNDGKFRAEDAWPPTNTTWSTLYLGKGSLAAQPGTGTLSYRDDGTGTTRDELIGVNWLGFNGEPLTAALHIAGAPRIQFKASSDMPGTHFDVLLYDVSDKGRELITRGHLDARHRESLEQGKDLAMGTIYDYAFDLHPNDYIVQAGHRLVLVVKSTDDYVVRSPYRAMNTITLGESTLLLLPIADDGTRLRADAPPAPWVQ